MPALMGLLEVTEHDLQNMEGNVARIEGMKKGSLGAGRRRRRRAASSRRRRRAASRRRRRRRSA